LGLYQGERGWHDSSRPLGVCAIQKPRVREALEAVLPVMEGLVTESNDPKANPSRFSWTFERVLSALFIVVLLLSAVATVGVMRGTMPPLFNQRAAVYNLANAVCLCGLLLVVIALVTAGLVKRIAWVRRVILLLLVTLSTVEALLFVFDRYFISAEGSPNRSAFRNVWVHGEPIWLAQPTPNSSFGFRNPITPPSQKEDYHILFLGNSFVNGSGSSFATNYPQVVASELRSALPDRNVGVLSAGVDGYGMKEERLVYEHLIEKGLKFDLVVVNFNMGSDPTNDIPGTLRKSVAGEPQRFPENWFLRQFYPVDTYLFRYAYYFEITFNPRFDLNDSPKATCETTSSFINYSNERTWLYYGAGAEKRLYLDYNVGELFKIADVAKANGARVVVVLIPDRFGVLPPTQAHFSGSDIDRTWTLRFMQERVGTKLPMFDLTPYFVDRPDLFECNNLHWNDPGNLEGARRVTDYLVRFMGGDAGNVAMAAPASN
jgi:hypothetical protein